MQPRGNERLSDGAQINGREPQYRLQYYVVVAVEEEEAEASA